VKFEPPYFQSRAQEQVSLFMGLTQDQKEFFMSLLPNWYFSVEELVEAVKSLSD
jgi:hypothetical protein